MAEPTETHSALAKSEIAPALARGVCRALGARGFVTLTEFTLKSGRRADVFAIGSDGTVLIVEIKSSVPDFRSDRKWPDYREFCDLFYFAVDEDFPRAILPPDTGLIVADPYDAAFVREAPKHALHPSRRKTVTLRFARAAGTRLYRLEHNAAADCTVAADD